MKEPARPLLVGVLAAPSAAGVARLARSAAAARCDLLELRADLLGPGETLDAALAAADGRDLLVTCRPEREGGGFRGSEEDRVRLLERAARAPAVRLVDVELSCAAPCSFVPAARRVVSFHDFAGTPPDLEEIARRAVETGAAHAKIVASPDRHADAVRLLALNGPSGVSRVTAFGMGSVAFPTRVLAAARGAGLVYAALEPAAATAPGQATVDDLDATYRLRAIGPATRVLGIAGDPVAHSRSPRLHNALLAASGVDAVYLPFHAPDFRDLWSARDAWRLAGLSVTIPHKVVAARLADRLDPLAARIGAVNTLVRGEDGHFTGHNTDATGAIESLDAAAGGEAALRKRLAGGARVVLVGAGGAARAIGHALRERGARVGIVVNRDEARAETLARELGLASGPLDALRAETADVLVQATSAGMGAPDETVVPASILGHRVLVFETVYVPEETRLVREARAAGARVVTGVEMFLRQAAAQFRLFTGIDPGLAAVREAFAATAPRGA